MVRFLNPEIVEMVDRSYIVLQDYFKTHLIILKNNFITNYFLRLLLGDFKTTLRPDKDYFKVISRLICQSQPALNFKSIETERPYFHLDPATHPLLQSHFKTNKRLL